MLDLAAERLTVRASWEVLRPGRFALFSRFIGRLMGWVYTLTGKDRYDDYRLERVQGAPIIVIPSVANPRLLRTGAFFAAKLNVAGVDADAHVLDMGTGSGITAVVAAKFARRVVAVDINAAAVRCASINARLNKLEQRIETRHGDLFAPVAGERFDLVLFNPPFLRGTPRDDRERAWRSTDVAERFAADLGAHLKPGGAALVLLSSFGDARGFLEEFQRRGFAISVFAEHRFINERLAIFRLVLPRGRGAA
jgi:release factor glutamine methyltransferase